MLRSLLIGLSTIVLTLGPSRAADAALRAVSWEAAADGGAVVLRFDGAVPEFEVRPGVEEVRVAFAAAVPPALPEGVVAASGGGGLVIARPGASLRAVASAGGTLRIAFGTTPDEATYHLGVGDVIAVTVYKNEDLSKEYTVAPDGTFSMPLLGQVQAAGRTERELREQITKALAAEFLVDPQVSVSVRTYQSQYAYVTGSVGRAVRVPLRAGMSMKDVLSEAGVALAAGQEIVLGRTGGGTEGRPFTAEELESGSAPTPRDGDVLTVQERRYVFVNGEVRRPQRLVHTPGLTLLQAIAITEGLTDWANKRNVRILRGEGDARTEIRVNLKKVETRDAQDPALQPGDVILVERRIL